MSDPIISASLPKSEIYGFSQCQEQAGLQRSKLCPKAVCSQKMGDRSSDMSSEIRHVQSRRVPRLSSSTNEDQSLTLSSLFSNIARLVRIHKIHQRSKRKDTPRVEPQKRKPPHKTPPLIVNCRLNEQTKDDE